MLQCPADKRPGIVARFEIILLSLAPDRQLKQLESLSFGLIAILAKQAAAATSFGQAWQHVPDLKSSRPFGLGLVGRGLLQAALGQHLAVHTQQ